MLLCASVRLCRSSNDGNITPPPTVDAVEEAVSEYRGRVRWMLTTNFLLRAWKGPLSYHTELLRTDESIAFVWRKRPLTDGEIVTVAAVGCCTRSGQVRSGQMQYSMYSMYSESKVPCHITKLTCPFPPTHQLTIS